MPEPQYPATGHPSGKAELGLVQPEQGAPPEVHHGQAAGEHNFEDPTGKYKLVLGGTFSAVEATVTPSDSFKAEGGAMVTMSDNVDLQVKLDGGVGTACCRSCCASESAFMTYFSLKGGDRGDVLLSPALPGDIMLLHLDGKQEWRVQKGSFFCSDHTVDIGVSLQGPVAGCCSGEGFFILKAKGEGRLLLNTYGALIRYDLQPGEVRKIDNGYLVAWPADMEYSVGLASSSMLESLLSGEGFVVTFKGPGVVYAQTRTITTLASALRPYLMGGGSRGQ